VSDDPTPRAREVIFGSQQDRIQQRLDDLDPDLGGYIRDFAYDTVYDRPGLDLKSKELIACALLVSLGSPPELRTHIRGAMNAGATEDEVRGALLMCVPYLGFPRTVAFEVLRQHLER
jgi:4-carboxymuconolactone decarboxylase